jgi:hypothetical protein
MTYGYRRAPFGNLARISEDHGRTWSAPLVISNDGAGSDLGYPSTAELPNGEFVTVWYERQKDSRSAAQGALASATDLAVFPRGGPPLCVDRRPESFG